MGLCAVNEQGAARKSVYPSGNRHGDAKKSRCSQQPNRSLRCLTNRACARSVAAQSHNTPEEITSFSRRKWITAIASTHDLSDGNPETVALHRPHLSVAVGASQSRRMQSSGLTSLIYGTIIAFELQQLIWIKVLWLTQRGREPTIDLLAALYHFPPVASIQAAQLHVTQP